MNKKVLIIGSLIVVVGIVYFYIKSKKNAQASASNNTLPTQQTNATNSSNTNVSTATPTTATTSNVVTSSILNSATLPTTASGQIDINAVCVGCSDAEKQYLIDSNYVNGLVIPSVQNVINQIKNTPDWYSSVQSKALKYGRNIDVQLVLDAVYTIKNS
jgi:hypothetical protein